MTTARETLGVPFQSTAYAGTNLYCLVTEPHVNDLSKVALDSAAAGIEPAVSNRMSNALTTNASPSAQKSATERKPCEMSQLQRKKRHFHHEIRDAKQNDAGQVFTVSNKRE